MVVVQQSPRPSAGVRHLGALAVAGTLVLAGCSDPDSRAPGVWDVQTPSRIDADTITFTAVVRRAGCGNGVTGDVDPPQVAPQDEAVVITFTVAPIEGSATCPDNDEVRYEVVLPEPLGDRSLVDGQCESGTALASAAFCRPDGVRWRPG